MAYCASLPAVLAPGQSGQTDGCRFGAGQIREIRDHDDLELASAELAFTYDSRTHRLTLEVVNTSPVVKGVPNPVITDLVRDPHPLENIEVLADRVDVEALRTHAHQLPIAVGLGARIHDCA